VGAFDEKKNKSQKSRASVPLSGLNREILTNVFWFES
jgi:hypothetical protein